MSDEQGFDYKRAYESERAVRQRLEGRFGSSVWHHLWKIAVDFEPWLSAQSKPWTVVCALREMAKKLEEATQAAERANAEVASLIRAHRSMRERVMVAAGLNPSESLGDLLKRIEQLTSIASCVHGIGIDIGASTDRAYVIACVRRPQQGKFEVAGVADTADAEQVEKLREVVGPELFGKMQKHCAEHNARRMTGPGRGRDSEPPAKTEPTHDIPEPCSAQEDGGLDE